MEGVGRQVCFRLHARLRREGDEAPIGGSTARRRKGILSNKDILDMGGLTDFVVRATQPTVAGVRALAVRDAIHAVARWLLYANVDGRIVAVDVEHGVRGRRLRHRDDAMYWRETVSTLETVK